MAFKSYSVHYLTHLLAKRPVPVEHLIGSEWPNAPWNALLAWLIFQTIIGVRSSVRLVAHKTVGRNINKAINLPVPSFTKITSKWATNFD